MPPPVRCVCVSAMSVVTRNTPRPGLGGHWTRQPLVGREESPVVACSLYVRDEHDAGNRRPPPPLGTMPLYLRLFGRPSLTRDECQIPGVGAQSKALAFLGYLASADPDGVDRPVLKRLFWPDSSEEAARASLKQVMYHLRRDTGEPELFLPGSRIRLNRVCVQADLWDFDAAIALRNLDTAMATYGRGPLLDGTSLPRELQSWLGAEKHDRRQRLSHLASERVQSLLSAGAVGTAAKLWASSAALGLGVGELSERIAQVVAGPDLSECRTAALALERLSGGDGVVRAFHSAQMIEPQDAAPRRVRVKALRLAFMCTLGLAAITGAAVWDGPAVPVSRRQASLSSLAAGRAQMIPYQRANFDLFFSAPVARSLLTRVSIAESLLAAAPTIPSSKWRLIEALFVARRVDSAASLLTTLRLPVGDDHPIWGGVRFELLMAGGRFQEAVDLQLRRKAEMANDSVAWPGHQPFEINLFRAYMASRDTGKAEGLVLAYLASSPNAGRAIVQGLSWYGFGKGITDRIDRLLDSPALPVGGDIATPIPKLLGDPTSVLDSLESPSRSDRRYQSLFGGAPGAHDVSPELRWLIEVPAILGRTQEICGKVITAPRELRALVEFAAVAARVSGRCGGLYAHEWALSMLRRTDWVRRPGLREYYSALAEAGQPWGSCEQAIVWLETGFAAGLPFHPARFGQPEFNKCWSDVAFREAVPTKEFLDRALSAYGRFDGTRR